MPKFAENATHNTGENTGENTGPFSRIEALERELEATAIETERLGETVRFSAKLFGGPNPVESQIPDVPKIPKG